MKAIETGGEIRPNFYDGVKEVEVLQAGVQSAQSGERVAIASLQFIANRQPKRFRTVESGLKTVHQASSILCLARMEHVVKFGANTFIWASPFATATHLGLLDKAAAMGFDLLEVAVEDPALIDVPVLRRAAAAAGVGVLVCGAFGPDRNLSSAETAVHQQAADYLRWCIDAAAELSSPIVSGPMYSAVGKPRGWKRPLPAGKSGSVPSPICTIGAAMPNSKASGWRWNRSTGLKPT
jgi:hypothetical protein